MWKHSCHKRACSQFTIFLVWLNVIILPSWSSPYLPVCFAKRWLKLISNNGSKLKRKTTLASARAAYGHNAVAVFPHHCAQRQIFRVICQLSAGGYSPAEVLAVTSAGADIAACIFCTMSVRHEVLPVYRNVTDHFSRENVVQSLERLAVPAHCSNESRSCYRHVLLTVGDEAGSEIWR